jgi:hypothetical protein
MSENFTLCNFGENKHIEEYIKDYCIQPCENKKLEINKIIDYICKQLDLYRFRRLSSTKIILAFVCIDDWCSIIYRSGDYHYFYVKVNLKDDPYHTNIDDDIDDDDIDNQYQWGCGKIQESIFLRDFDISDIIDINKVNAIKTNYHSNNKKLKRKAIKEVLKHKYQEDVQSIYKINGKYKDDTFDTYLCESHNVFFRIAIIDENINMIHLDN